MKKKSKQISFKRYLPAVLFLVFIMAVMPIKAFAQTSSTNYKIEESHFGPGGELDANSAHYNAQQTVGEQTIGNTSSTNYQANAGFNTKDEPYLEVYVTGGNTDLGTLSPSSTSTTTSTFYVRAYLASGYSVIMNSDPPTYNTHQITPMASQAAASPGTEQFGINLKANTSPTTFGADPSQAPDSTFGYGYATPGYDTANVYKYNKGDVIARSDKSSGRTDYTISYIYDISSLSLAGEYVFTQDLIVIATY
ncbi:MAG TPA: hypothetical protein VFW77_03890 [Candidatus Saccharimonadales bacterium]|nr:hypothetical protein [Candidatus Saccharimonadales bacterium]